MNVNDRPCQVVIFITVPLGLLLCLSQCILILTQIYGEVTVRLGMEVGTKMTMTGGSECRKLVRHSEICTAVAELRGWSAMAAGANKAQNKEEGVRGNWCSNGMKNEDDEDLVSLQIQWVEREGRGILNLHNM